MARLEIDTVATHRQVTTALSAPHAGPALVSGAESSAPTTVELDSRPGWETVALDDLTAVTDLLDHLENHGVRESELVILGEQSFVVRWRSTS